MAKVSRTALWRAAFWHQAVHRWSLGSWRRRGLRLVALGVMAGIASVSGAQSLSWAEATTEVGTDQAPASPKYAPGPCVPGAGTARAFAGVDSIDQICGPELRWEHHRIIPWQVFAQGEYVGPSRAPHVPEYRVRVDDEIQFIYRLTREMRAGSYELNVGDRIRVESLSDENLDRELTVQPDGTITLRLLGQVRAAGKTVEQLRQDLNELYQKYLKQPAITVTPVEVNRRLLDLLAAVDNRYGIGGQSLTVRVSPDGTVQLPAIGSVPAQCLTLNELKMEVDERYRAIVDGMDVTPILSRRAPRFIYVLGEVQQPGRFELQGPTTAMQAIALAGGWRVGGNLRQIVVFRRGEDWRLMATKLDLRGALYARRPAPSDEIWLRDSDIVLVPKMPLQRVNDAIELLFGRGINPMIPLAVGLEILEPTVL